MKGNASVKNNTVSVSNSLYSACGGGVYIDKGDFIIEGGTISGNTASGGNYGSASGGGVYINNGIFNMKSGTISTNTASGKSSLADSVRGGGVCSVANVNGVDTFIMENGTISDNTAIISGTGAVQSYGGGVYTRNLVMKGGTITGNTVSATGSSGNSIVIAVGGGVNGILTMEGGIISGNTVSASNSVSSGNVRVQGGGMGGTLTKTGGTIYGNDAADGLKNTVPVGGQGHAVYCSYPENWRNATAGPAMNTDVYGFWLNEEEEFEFPSGFIGTWKRTNFDNTLTLTSTTLKSSSQDFICTLFKISGDSYILKVGDSTGGVTIKLIDGNLVISEDRGSGENNWNGTWIKQ